MLSLKLNRYLLSVVGCLLISISTSVHATSKAQAVKAGFVYNFTKFTSWPTTEHKSEHFNLCVVGDDGLDGALESLYGKNVGGQSIVLMHLTGEDDLSECQIAYIENNQSTMINALKQLRHMPILTVSEFPGFIDYGGMIELVRDDRRVAFNINFKSVQTAGLVLSAQLLKLAKIVKGLK